MKQLHLAHALNPFEKIASTFAVPANHLGIHRADKK